MLGVGVAYAHRLKPTRVAEFYALLATAAAGMMFMVAAGNLMTLFLGLEWFSITLYILCAIDLDRPDSLEAGLKYLIVGSFGSAVLLFGSALVYGSTQELGFREIAAATAAQDLTGDALLVAGLAMIIAGLAFKASAAPFHMWTPDVYQGAPTPVTAFMSAATKVAALVVTLRILTIAFPELDQMWTIAIAVIACISLAVGNLGALVQIEREAPARVLVDLAGRLHADPDRRRTPRSAAARCSSTCSSTGRCRSARSPSSPRASGS